MSASPCTAPKKPTVAALGLVLAVALGTGVQSTFAQQVSYAPGVEGQIWQQLPAFGRGVDLVNERPITTTPPAAPTFSDPGLPGVADLWPCTSDSMGFPSLCFPSGLIDVGPGVAPDVAQNYAGRFAPCVGNQCYPSGLIGLGSAVTWAMGPCVMQPGANGVDCYPSGTAGVGPRVPPANGQLAGAAAIAVDNNPASPNAGTVYVTDKWNHRVLGFHFDGSLVAFAHPIGNGVAGGGPYSQVVGGQTFTGELLNNPERLQIDAVGNLIVADAGNGRLAVFDTSGNLIESLEIPDAEGGQNFGRPGFAAPTGLAMTAGASWRGAGNPPGSTLVVTDQYNCAVYFFDATTLAVRATAGGSHCADFGNTPAFDTLAAVEGAAIDDAGHAYAADYDRNRIEIFDTTTGAMIGAFGDPLDGAVAPSALNGPTDVMIDHLGVFTETDAQGTHQVARVWVADAGNQRLAVFKVNFDNPTPVATFLFELNAAGDLNGYPGDLAEDTSHDPVGKILTTDSNNARIQRFQVPDLAVVNVTGDATTQTVSFDVLVPQGKDPVGVTTVTPMVCPTSPGTTVSSGIASPQPACAAARKLTSAGTLTPGQSVSYSFQFASSQNTATFDIYATGNVFNNVPQTTSNTAVATVTTSCPTCAIAPQVVLPAGTLEALTTPVLPSTLHVGAHVYTTQVAVRITATSGIGLATMQYRFISGPETGASAQPGLHTVMVSGASASIDVPFRTHGTSVVEFWATNVDGTGIAPRQAQLTLDLAPPEIFFQFPQASSSNATAPNALGWWNKPVSLPLNFTGQITAVSPLGAGMASNPPLASPVRFTTEGRNLGFQVTVTDPYGLTATKASNDPLTDGQPVNVDMTAPSFVSNAALTLERASFAGAPLPAAAALLALASDPNLTNGAIGSGLVSVTPAAAVANYPLGSNSVAFVATDAAGNSKNGNVTVKVQDTVKPVLTGPATLSVNPGALGTLFTLGGFAVSDASMINAPAGTNPVTVTQSASAALSLLVNTTTAVTLTATDPSGNASTLVVNVTAKLPDVDTTAPVITACAAPVTLFTPGTSPVALPNLVPGVTANDYSGVTVTQAPAAGTQYTLVSGQTTLAIAVILTATDGSPAKNRSTCSTTVTIKKATQPPVLTQGNLTVTATTEKGAAVSFAPTVVDPVDGTNKNLVSCSKASGSTFAFGTTTVTCSATDSAGLTGTVSFTVTVTHSAPVCDAGKASPSLLWPPNHKMVNIGLVGLKTADGATISTKVTGIFQDEPTDGLGDGDTPIDGAIVNGAAQVRAERSGEGNGRVYYVKYTATTSGGSCSGTAAVSVPHDQAHSAVGNGANYDSTKAGSARGDACHGESNHGHHDKDGCDKNHHGHYDGDNCQGRSGYDHDGDGHGGGRNGGSHRR